MAAHSTQLFEDPERWAAQKLKPGLPPQRLILWHRLANNPQKAKNVRFWTKSWEK